MTVLFGPWRISVASQIKQGQTGTNLVKNKTNVLIKINYPNYKLKKKKVLIYAKEKYAPQAKFSERVRKFFVSWVKKSILFFGNKNKKFQV